MTANTKPPENCSPPCQTAMASSGESRSSRCDSTQVIREPTTPAHDHAHRQAVGGVAGDPVLLAVAGREPRAEQHADRRPRTRRCGASSGPSSIVGKVVYGMAATRLSTGQWSHAAVQEDSRRPSWLRVSASERLVPAADVGGEASRRRSGPRCPGGRGSPGAGRRGRPRRCATARRARPPGRSGGRRPPWRRRAAAGRPPARSPNTSS